MDVILQAHRAKMSLPVPSGLRELSSDIAREVLRNQPQHIHRFVADYLETMLEVRERARDAVGLVSDIYSQGFYLDELCKRKKVTQEGVKQFATVIQANWRGYVVRRKLAEWLKKKQRWKEERAVQRSIKIKELLDEMGITTEEANRAASVIQGAYKDWRRRRWIINEAGEKVWLEEYEGEWDENIRYGQRIKENDWARGRHDRWQNLDWGDMLEMKEPQQPRHLWPRVGQLLKVLRENVPPGAELVQFFAMRDLRGREQYSFMTQFQPGEDPRGLPVGFLIPASSQAHEEGKTQVAFLDTEKQVQVGNFTYVFQDEVEMKELEKMFNLLQEHIEVSTQAGQKDPNDVQEGMPRALVKIHKKFMAPDDDEVKLPKHQIGISKKAPELTYRAETVLQTWKLIQNILECKAATFREALNVVTRAAPYRPHMVARLLEVEQFGGFHQIQKIVILPESSTGEREDEDMNRFQYVFLRDLQQLPKGESPLEIPITRFQGYRRDYRGSSGFDEKQKVFILGPMVTSQEGKPLTFESFFWEKIGIDAWYQILQGGEGLLTAEVEDQNVLRFKAVSVTSLQSEAQQKPDTLTIQAATEEQKMPVEPSLTVVEPEKESPAGEAMGPGKEEKGKPIEEHRQSDQSSGSSSSGHARSHKSPSGTHSPATPIDPGPKDNNDDDEEDID